MVPPKSEDEGGGHLPQMPHPGSAIGVNKKYMNWMNQKLKNFKRGIGLGITEKSHETRRDCWGGIVERHSAIVVQFLIQL